MGTKKRHVAGIDDLLPSLDDVHGAVDLAYARERLRKTAEGFESSNDLEKALDYCDQMLSIEVNDIETLKRKSRISKELGRLEDALKCCDRVIELNLYSMDAWLSKEECLERAGRLEDALSCCRDLLRLFPDEEHELLAADVLCKLNRFKEATQYCAKLLERRPLHVGALLGLGDALSQMGRLEESYRYYGRAAEVAPDDKRVWRRIAELMARRNKPDLAVIFYDFAISNDKKDLDAWLGKGVALLDAGRFQEASECFDAALRLDPKERRAAEGREMVERAITGP